MDANKIWKSASWTCRIYLNTWQIYIQTTAQCKRLSSDCIWLKLPSMSMKLLWDQYRHCVLSSLYTVTKRKTALFHDNTADTITKAALLLSCNVYVGKCSRCNEWSIIKFSHLGWVYKYFYVTFNLPGTKKVWEVNWIVIGWKAGLLSWHLLWTVKQWPVL